MKFHLGISMQYIMTVVRYSKKYKGGHCHATRGISIFILVRQKVKWDSLKCKEELVLDSGCDRMWQRQCFGHIPRKFYLCRRTQLAGKNSKQANE